MIRHRLLRHTLPIATIVLLLASMPASRAEPTLVTDTSRNPRYSVGLTLGMISSTQNAAGSSAVNRFGFGLNFGIEVLDQAFLGVEAVSSKPLDQVRVTDYLLTAVHRFGNFDFGVALGVQSLIDDRAAVAYIDPLTLTPVKETSDAFIYGVSVAYDFIFDRKVDDIAFGITPSLRHLRAGGNSFFSQWVAMLEFKLWGYK